MAPFDSEHFPLPRPIPEGHRRMEDLEFQMPQKAFAPSPPVAPSVDDDVLRVLIEGRQIISEPEHWVQGPFAVTAACVEIDPRNRDAVSFCSAGALKRACYDAGCGTAYPVWGAARKLLSQAVAPQLRKGMFDDSHHIGFNDATGRTHAEVMGMWDRAIAARQAELAKALS